MANFSLQFHPWGTHQGHENNNDHKLKKLSIVTQILSIDILGKYASYSIENMYTDVKNARILHPQFQTYQESSRPVQRLIGTNFKTCLVINKFFSGAWYDQ